jgi:hypothetical protein
VQDLPAEAIGFADRSRGMAGIVDRQGSEVLRWSDHGWSGKLR